MAQLTIDGSAQQIEDTNGNELVKFGETASAVNELLLRNAATGNNPAVEASGGDSNVSVNLKAKGTGIIQLLDGNGNEVLKTVAAVASAINELSVTNAAAGNSPILSATGGDTDISIAHTPKGTGTNVLNGGAKIGASGTTCKQVVTGTVAINPSSIAAGATGETAVTITGVAAGDIVVFEIPSALEAGLVYGGCYVSGANTVQVRLGNVTSGAIDGASLTWRYQWSDYT